MTPSTSRLCSGPGGSAPAEPAADGACTPALIRSMRRLGPAEHRLEHEEQHHREQQRAGDRVAAPRGRAARAAASARRHAIADGIAGCGAPRAAWPRCRQRSTQAARSHARLRERGVREDVGVDRLQQRAFAAWLHRDGLDHRHAQLLLERARGRAGSRAARATSLMLSATIMRPAQALQLQHQAQVEPQVGGIDHAHQQSGGGSLAWRPSTTSRAIASSRLAGSRL